MKYLKKNITGMCQVQQQKSIEMDSLRNSSAVRSCSNKRKDLVGLRDEMKLKRYQTRSDQKDGALSPFFIPEEKPPLHNKKEFLTSKESAVYQPFFPSFIIYDLNKKRSIKIYGNNRRKSHHASTYCHAA
jgi:hypothetical protein